MWLAAELPPEIPPACVIQVASEYKIPVELMVAVYKQERGLVGKEYVRSHGTYYGPYQISDKWVPHFAKWGYTADMLRDDGCANAIAGGYILAYYYAREQNWPRAIARYNTGSITKERQIEAGSRYVKNVLNHWASLYKKWNPK